MDYEDIIEDIGGFKKWQILIFTSISFPDVFFSMAIMAPVFIGVEPPWTCLSAFGNATILTASNVSLEHSMDVSYDFNERNSTLKNSNGSLKASNLLCGVCEKRIYQGDFTSIVSEWDLVCDKDYISDVISSIQMSGLLLGAAGFAQLSDTFGRKSSLFVTILLLFISGIASAFAVNWQMFAAFRFLLGVSAGGYYCIDCVYPMEFINRRWRTLCGTVGFWAIGQSLLALLAYFIRDWHKLILFTTLPLVLYAISWCWIPESPRWLAQKQRIKEAKAVFCNIARRNNRPEPDLSFLDTLLSADSKAKKRDDTTKKYSYVDLFRTQHLAKISIITMLMWFVVYLTYYEISFNVKHLSGNRYINQFIASIMDLSGMFYVLFFNNIIGRRICLLIGIIGTIATNIALFVIFILNKETAIATVVNVFALVGKSFATATTYSVQIMSAELFPTDVRNVGVGAGASSARVGSLLGPLLLYAGTRFKLVPYCVMGLLSAVILPMCFLLPETNGKPLVDDFNLFTKQGTIDADRKEDNKDVVFVNTDLDSSNINELKTVENTKL